MMKISQDVRQRAAKYPKSVRWSDENEAFIGSIAGLCGDCHHGDNPVEVFGALVRLAEETVAEWDAAGLTLPEPPASTVEAMTRSASR